MSEESLVAPVASTESTATITTNVPEVVTPEATTDAGLKPEAADAKPEKTAEQKELEYLRRKASKSDRNNARMHQELETLRKQAPAGQAAPQGDAAVDPVALADHIATAREIAKQSNDVAKAGKERFAATWDASLAVVIEEAGPLIDKRSMLPTPLGEAILDSDDPAALLHHLGSDPSLAEELSDLSPAKLGRRLLAIEQEMKAKPGKPVSKAPPPINPLGGNAANGVVDLETADFATYEREREKRGARWLRR